jgi:DNA repair protein RadC
VCESADTGRGAVDAPGDPHYFGHRKRLRERFLSGGAESVQDYELLELLLSEAIARRDVKPLAKELLRQFGDLWNVCNATAERLQSVRAPGLVMSERAVTLLRVVGATVLRAMRQQVMHRRVLSSWQALIDYCAAAMAHETTEQFRLLFLDRRNALIADEVQQHGTVDHAPVYPREVVRRALELGATAVILVHNHPSGDPTPSRADVEMTKEIVRVALAVGIAVHDHVVVGRGRTASFKALGLL